MKSETILSKPKQIRKILSNFESYHQLNPLTKNFEYELQEGTELRASFEPTKESMDLKPNILAAEPRELQWQGHLLSHELLNGDHEHIIFKDTLTENMARFTQPENFSGILGPLLTENLEDSAILRKAELALKKKVHSESD